MNALDIITNIVSNETLSQYPFRYCLVTRNKCPYTINDVLARPDVKEDFCELNDLLSCKSLSNYVGVGISIQASDICAIDVDHCFGVPFDVESVDGRGKDIINRFKNKCYIEFSFSGTGLRILFKTSPIENYSEKYYTKNDKTQCEYYFPTANARYVTLTGKTIYNNPFDKDVTNELQLFLDAYMQRPKRMSIRGNKTDEKETRSLDELLKIAKNLCITHYEFQNIWLDKEHDTFLNGASKESNKDYSLCIQIYQYITKDREMMKQVFESSPYFKTKDAKHVKKWNYGNFRYFNYIYDNL